MATLGGRVKFPVGLENGALFRFNHAAVEQIGLDRLSGIVAFARSASLGSYTAAARVLKVAASLPMGMHLLAPALPELRDRYPRLSVDLRLSDRLVDIIEESFDIAIRVGDLADSRRIAPHRVCAYASPAYLERRGTPEHPDDLVHHDCVNFRYQSSGQVLRWPFRIGGRVAEVTPDPRITVDASEGVAAVLVAGGGIGVSPTYLAASYVERGLLVPVLREFAVTRSNVTALWPESRRGSPNIRAFLAFLDKVFPSSTL